LAPGCISYGAGENELHSSRLAARCREGESMYTAMSRADMTSGCHKQTDSRSNSHERLYAFEADIAPRRRDNDHDDERHDERHGCPKPKLEGLHQVGH